MSKKKDFFWASYADLMTSMFFIMLVLFVLAVVMFKQKASELKAELEEFKKIEEIKKSINSINEEYFEYSPEFKKHIFKVEVAYYAGQSKIASLKDPSVIPSIIDAGNAIKNLIINMSGDKLGSNIQYLIIIEGQASLDAYPGNDVLSYQRALNLKEFWIENDINLEGLPNCELVVAGSGVGGVPRDENDEKKNQRFLIHIIPKTGIVE